MKLYSRGWAEALNIKRGGYAPGAYHMRQAHIYMRQAHINMRQAHIRRILHLTRIRIAEQHKGKQDQFNN